MDSYEKKHHQRHSMSIEVRMNKGKWRNELAIWKQPRIKNSGSAGWHRSLVKKHRRDKPRTWVQILASVRFLFYSVAFILLCYPCEALEGPISTRVCTN